MSTRILQKPYGLLTPLVLGLKARICGILTFMWSLGARSNDECDVVFDTSWDPKSLSFCTTPTPHSPRSSSAKQARLEAGMLDLRVANLGLNLVICG